MDDQRLNSVGALLNPVLDYIQMGFNQVNAAQGLAIALIAAILMRKWLQLPMVALMATVGHAIIDTAIPIVAGRSALKLPPLVEPSYWQYLAALFAGYLIIVALFNMTKRGLVGLVKRAVPASSATPAALSASSATPAAADTASRPAAPSPGKHK